MHFIRSLTHKLWTVLVRLFSCTHFVTTKDNMVEKRRWVHTYIVVGSIAATPYSSPPRIACSKQNQRVAIFTQRNSHIPGNTLTGICLYVYVFTAFDAAWLKIFIRGGPYNVFRLIS